MLTNKIYNIKIICKNQGNLSHLHLFNFNKLKLKKKWIKLYRHIKKLQITKKLLKLYLNQNENITYNKHIHLIDMTQGIHWYQDHNSDKRFKLLAKICTYRSWVPNGSVPKFGMDPQIKVMTKFCLDIASEPM